MTRAAPIGSAAFRAALAVLMCLLLARARASSICDLGAGQLWLYSAEVNATEATGPVYVGLSLTDEPSISLEELDTAEGRVKRLQFKGVEGAVAISELAEDVGLGHAIWPSALTLGAWLASQPRHVAGLSVIELGAGVGGLPGIVSSLVSPAPSDVLLTEHSAALLKTLRANAERNGGGAPVEVETLNWDDVQHRRRFDVALGADLIYSPAHAITLTRALTRLLRLGGTFHLVNTPSCAGGPADEARPGFAQFVEALHDHGRVNRTRFVLVHQPKGEAKRSATYLDYVTFVHAPNGKAPVPPHRRRRVHDEMR